MGLGVLIAATGAGMNHMPKLGKTKEAVGP